ncbi:MAG: radical SAM family heme chaperone HemW [Mariniphaga sp.]
MSGIYFHIPFCKSKCNYCDFYSGRNLQRIDELVKSEIAELIVRKDYILNEVVNTIYFGGGSPSLLSIEQILLILSTVREYYNVSETCEITLEANPEDLTQEYLFLLFQSGVNRLSIGIQSFNDEILTYLGRRHNSSKLPYIIAGAQNIGFNNISVDLIFGIPGMSYELYLESVQEVLKLGIQHISAYSLTIEKGTYFGKLLNQNKIIEISEEDLLKQFNSTIDLLKNHGFDHYEISNYAKEGFISRHNSAYWNDQVYLGIGPSAHSFNRISRQWNVSNTVQYCSNISLSKPFFEVEFLTEADKFNEYLITGLRTSKGISNSYLVKNFNMDIYSYFIKNLKLLSNGDCIVYEEDRIYLTRKGLLISDYITRLLFFAP